jgi:biofilm PGA synthesis protein PgaA
MRELWVQASATFSSGSQFGSRDLDLDTRLYSVPQKLRYRVFGRDYLAQATFPEGKAAYHRFGAGLEYRARDLELSGELSDGFGRDAGVGLALRGLWMADDHWRFSGAYDSYSNEVPLRGRLNDDLDGWSLGANAEYRVHESRSFAAGLQYLEFSDGNQRTIENASAFQRLINRPRYKLDGRLGIYASQNTRNATSYYNPGSDLSLDASVINEWLLMRRYDRSFLHRLGLSLGMYEENGFSDKLVPGLFYEHEWRLYDRINLIYGVALNRPAYDGVYETHTRLYLNLHWRF